jgi:hypothetical protein
MVKPNPGPWRCVKWIWRPDEDLLRTDLRLVISVKWSLCTDFLLVEPLHGPSTHSLVVEQFQNINMTRLTCIAFPLLSHSSAGGIGKKKATVKA